MLQDILKQDPIVIAVLQGILRQDPIVIAVLQGILKQDPIVIAVFQGIVKQDPIVIAVLQGILKQDPIVIAVFQGIVKQDPIVIAVLQGILKQDPIADLAVQAGRYPGPLDEINFWTSHLEKLHSVNTQLSSAIAVDILNNLQHADSTYAYSFQNVRKDITKVRFNGSYCPCHITHNF